MTAPDAGAVPAPGSDAALYVIYWRSVITGATGHGMGAFPLWQAEMIRDTLSAANAGLLTHWIEPTMRPRTDAETGGPHVD